MHTAGLITCRDVARYSQYTIQNFTASTWNSSLQPAHTADLYNQHIVIYVTISAQFSALKIVNGVVHKYFMTVELCYGKDPRKVILTKDAC